MLSGAPLGWDLPGRIGLEIRAIVAGGLRILDKIEQSITMSSTGGRVLQAHRLAADLALAGRPSGRQAMTPDEYCQERAAASGSSFYYSFLFLPPERRQAITALYAFCREVDDVVDECPDPQLARTKLAWWRSEVAACTTARPSHPVTSGAGDVADGASACRRNNCWKSSTAWKWTSSRPAMPGLQGPAPLLLPRRQRGRPARGRDLRLHRPPDAEVRPRPGPGLPAHQHHPRRRRRRAARPHLPAAGRTAALRRAGADILDARYTDNFRR
jgi:hypothetical protein